MHKKAWLAMAAAGVLGMGLSTAASAQDFWYNAYGGFVEGEEGAAFPDPVVYGSPNEFGNISGTLYSEVAWGTEVTGNSGLALNDPDQVSEIAGKPPISVIDEENNRHINTGVEESTDGNRMGWLTHINEVISEPFGPEGAILNMDYYLDIYDNPDKEGDPVGSFGALPFQLQVWETQNDPGEDECPQGTEPCSDRFQYRITMDGSDFGDAIDGLDLGTFQDNDSTYAVSATGFYDGEGELVGEFWSPEQTTSTGYVNLEIHEQVPEPATVGLMGVGLVGLAFLGFRRRREEDLMA